MVVHPGRSHQEMEGGEAGRMKTDTRQDCGKVGKPSWLGKWQQLEVFSEKSSK